MYLSQIVVESLDDSEELNMLAHSLLLERDRERQRANEQARRAGDLHFGNLRLQVELGRDKKWYYDRRAERLRSAGDLAQFLLGTAEALDRKPTNPDDGSPDAAPEEELRRVMRCKVRCHLANFENLPVTC